jgi:hypothetical protein
LIKAGKTLEEILAAKPVGGLYKGESLVPDDVFVKVVYEDLTGKYRKK